MSVRVIVCAHKAYRMPEDPMYVPLHVGRAGKDLDLGFRGDDTGENISEKNPAWCELTGLYWAWRNLDADYIGLAHYRRHFRGKRGRDKWASILTEREAEELLSETPVLLPGRRNYYIETVYNQYVHAHPAEPLDLALSLAAGCGPEYARAAENVKKRTWTHIYNMFIMRRDILEDYCAWLFGILGEVERQIDTSGYSAYDRRVFGFLGERLLDVYLEANGIPYREIPAMFMEKQNWIKKGGAFLLRKLRAGKAD